MPKSSLLSGALAAAVLIAFQPAAAALQDRPSAWREVATDHDRARLRGWRRAWTEALRQARSTHRNEVERAGALVDPDAALLRPELPPGDYRCRTVKIGRQGSASLNWVAYPEFRCRVARVGGALTFTRLGGSQRPIGRLYPDNVRRMIFLGSLQLAEERQVLPYGGDADRDMAGILERIGERRWRLVFPRPTFESIIDVIELVPA